MKIIDMKKTLLLTFLTALALSNTVHANEILDSSFESTNNQNRQINWSSNDYHKWGVGDAFKVVASENGISPQHGEKMLSFNTTGGGTSVDVYQIVDISNYAELVDAGLVSAKISAFFNSTKPNTFGLRIIGWTTPPTNFNGMSFDGGNFSSALTTDGNPNTWQPVSYTETIPSGIRFVALGIHANMKGQETSYADQAKLILDTPCSRMRAKP